MCTDSPTFAFPSLHDGFGIPLPEAMACGCPIFTAKTCAPPEVVGSTAILVDPLDIDAIAEGMFTMLSNAQLSEDYAIRGLKRANEFGWERCAIEVLAVFESLAPLALWSAYSPSRGQ